MKEGAIIHLVLASSISFAPPQAAGLIHSAARPLPTWSYDLAGAPCAIALCEAIGFLQARITGLCPAPFRLPSSSQAPSRSLPRQARKLTHSAAPPLPTRSSDLVGAL